MDWVKGRPPDALLYLKALIKAAPLPLPSPLTPPTPTPLPSLTAVAAADVTAAAAPDDSRRAADTALTHATGAVAAATDKEGVEVPVVAVANVSVPEMLAEGALLGPLGDVGTIAGAIRRKIGGNLREMAAARCVRS